MDKVNHGSSFRQHFSEGSKEMPIELYGNHRAAMLNEGEGE
jgi:hypothetical protein